MITGVDDYSWKGRITDPLLSRLLNAELGSSAA
jgi:hypothetical protein